MPFLVFSLFSERRALPTNDLTALIPATSLNNALDSLFISSAASFGSIFETLSRSSMSFGLMRSNSGPDCIIDMASTIPL